MGLADEPKKRLQKTETETLRRRCNRHLYAMVDVCFPFVEQWIPAGEGILSGLT